MTSDKIMISLGHGQFYCLNFLPGRFSICLMIVLKKVQPSSAELRISLMDFFQTNVGAICNEFLPACTPPIIYVPCQICQQPHIKLEDLKKGCPLMCEDECIDKDYYLDLLQKQGNACILIFINNITIFNRF